METRLFRSCSALRFVCLMSFLVLLSASCLVIEGCGGSPKSKINIAIDKYERMVDDYIETSRKIDEGSMTVDDAKKKVGEDIIERLVTKRQEIDDMIEEYQHELTEDERETFYRKLEAIETMIREKT
jgi:hypothetical protein